MIPWEEQETDGNLLRALYILTNGTVSLELGAVGLKFLHGADSGTCKKVQKHGLSNLGKKKP